VRIILVICRRISQILPSIFYDSDDHCTDLSTITKRTMGKTSQILNDRYNESYSTRLLYSFLSKCWLAIERCSLVPTLLKGQTAWPSGLGSGALELALLLAFCLVHTARQPVSMRPSPVAALLFQIYACDRTHSGE